MDAAISSMTISKKRAVMFNFIQFLFLALDCWIERNCKFIINKYNELLITSDLPFCQRKSHIKALDQRQCNTNTTNS